MFKGRASIAASRGLDGGAKSLLNCVRQSDLLTHAAVVRANRRTRPLRAQIESSDEPAHDGSGLGAK